jgi:hypothetical protein
MISAWTPLAGNILEKAFGVRQLPSLDLLDLTMFEDAISDVVWAE